MTAPGLLVVAGEASGEQRAARLLEALASRAPGLACFGLGSRALAGAGVELVADSHEISVVGISEALEILPRAAEILRALLAEVERRRPRCSWISRTSTCAWRESSRGAECRCSTTSARRSGPGAADASG